MELLSIGFIHIRTCRDGSGHIYIFWLSVPRKLNIIYLTDTYKFLHDLSFHITKFAFLRSCWIYYYVKWLRISRAYHVIHETYGGQRVFRWWVRILNMALSLLLNDDHAIYKPFARLQSVSWSLAEFRHNKIVQSPHENYFNLCRQHKEKWDLVKMTIIQTGW